MPIISFLISLILVLPAGFSFYQSWFGLTPVQEINLAIALLAVYLLLSEAVPLYVTGFLILFLELIWLLPNWGASTPKPIVFLSCYFSEAILLALGGFVISEAISHYKLNETLARFVIKNAIGSSLYLLLGLGFSTSFLSCWMNNTATTAMMLGLVFPIMKNLDLNSHLRKSVLFVIPFSANLGGIGTPVGTLPNVIGIGYMKEKGIDIGFLPWMAFAIPVFLISVLLLCGLLYWVFLRNKEEESGKLFVPHMSEVSNSKMQYNICYLIIGITIIGWMTSDLHKVSNGIIALIPIIAFFGLKLLELKHFRSLPWDVLILVGGGIALVKAMEETGLASQFVSVLSLGGKSSLSLFVAFSVISLGFSCFLSNNSVANLILPITMGLPAEVIFPAALGATIGASLAMSFPVSTPPNALAFSYGGIKSIEMAKIGGIISILALIVFLVVGGGILHFAGWVDFSH
ncbi:SLC13 family permease [Leptospira ilyithenensis]|uniref:DASS family sodium-coupled anion symporter n=1 Tax=Leptospira ilyithenensis TaxID=2484901 RepID=A0A4V3JWL1_9LEPT|nr:DASS family sodium-coupled anion symporter [Leptospira ilyithenensis]TGN06478.1 DASS family sodium-coupled anion symporter [Leptospira ilyithenensis]